MSGNGRFARFGGVVALGGAFHTATYITSYPGTAPPLAVIGLVAGTVAGILVCALPRSVASLAIADVLLLVAFSGAAVNSGIGFGPGLILVIAASLRSGHVTEPVPGADPEEEGSLADLWRVEHRVMRVPPALAKRWDRLVVLPEAEELLVPTKASDDEAANSRSVSQDGLVRAGPPGVIGAIGPPGRRGLAGGFG